MKLYNSLSRNIEEFIPINKGEVKIYSCGVTTYDEIHLGHVRQAVVFDVFRKFLEYLGNKVIYVRNFTDIDDKIIKKANESNRDPLELSDYYVKETVKDLRDLKVDDASYQPKVTESIPEIIAFIETLIKKGFAYVVEGEVLFEVDKFSNYGKLSGRKTENMVSADESVNKRKPYDFALWKPNKPGEPFWESPWGPGRPGWHIECSAMAKRFLGDTIDIHGGGIDLMFPHHENEIAQSEAATGKKLANYWMHNGLVNVNGQKMSKSLGNFYTVKDLLKKYTVDEIRLAVLSHNFSSSIDFSERLFLNTRKKLYDLYKILAKIKNIREETENKKVSKTGFEEIDKMEENFREAMENNFNTRKAMITIFQAFYKTKEVLAIQDVTKQKETANSLMSQLKRITPIIRILDEEPEEYIKKVKTEYLKQIGMSEAKVESLLKERKKAKENKDYQKSDEIRNNLINNKINVQDTKGGVVWDIDFSS